MCVVAQGAPGEAGRAPRRVADHHAEEEGVAWPGGRERGPKRALLKRTLQGQLHEKNHGVAQARMIIAQHVVLRGGDGQRRG